MDAAFSSRVVAWAAELFRDVSFVLYEQILPDDAFGRVMMANIKARGCDLLSIREYPTLEAQVERFRSHHFEAVQAWDMNQIYYEYLDAAERATYALRGSSPTRCFEGSLVPSVLTTMLRVYGALIAARSSRSLMKWKSSICCRPTTASWSRARARRRQPRKRWSSRSRAEQAEEGEGGMYSLSSGEGASGRWTPACR